VISTRIRMLTAARAQREIWNNVEGQVKLQDKNEAGRGIQGQARSWDDSRTSTVRYKRTQDIFVFLESSVFFVLFLFAIVTACFKQHCFSLKGQHFLVLFFNCIFHSAI